MLLLLGAPALSPFRAARLLERLGAVAPVTGAQATQVFAVQGAPTEEAGLARLLELLRARPLEDVGAAFHRWVFPRFGTISPWSSKATDIARNAGVQAERIERGTLYRLTLEVAADSETSAALESCLHDRMTEVVLRDASDASRCFQRGVRRPHGVVALAGGALSALGRANAAMGLALSDEELEYLAKSFAELGRDPTDVELMMFAQANSEHCRHKIFNARWTIDGAAQPRSLFDMIRHTHASAPDGVLSAYRDNAAVVAGLPAQWFHVDPATRAYGTSSEPLHLLAKAETHNHPTAIAPWPGAATGSGGEIRDEGATGRGSKPKAGLVGFSVSNLRLPGAVRPWEADLLGRPDRIASPLEIMLDGPLGAAAFNNEFGRPALAGWFRTYEERAPGASDDEVRGYHKPIMLAGGVGTIRQGHVQKGTIAAGDPILVLGGPAMLIGLGGGAASSVATGASAAELDFASVQRDNAEMQRRCQEVIDRCVALGEDNPIVSIHDVGAGGLSNALPELVHESGRGGRFDLSAIPTAEPGMTPLELWCNEAQERYVLAARADRLTQLLAIAERERCPLAVVGHATDDQRLVLEDPHFGSRPIDMPLPVLLGKPPRMERAATARRPTLTPLDRSSITLDEAIARVLTMPSVADKTFLVTIGDRSITGLVAREQMVGPYQVPVADVAVTLGDYVGFQGEAFALGERTPVALVSAAAAARLAVGEALTNLLAAPVQRLADVRLSANWMAAAGHPGEDAGLYEAVRAVGEELCPALGIAIPVGKDSMSMRTVWGDGRRVVSPLSLIVTAFAPVADARLTLTPELRPGQDTELLLVDLAPGKLRLGASALAQAYRQLGDDAPDLDDPALLRAFAVGMDRLRRRRLALAYHDRSDGGLLAAAAELAFASGVGLELELGEVSADPLAALFSEELGVVLQVRRSERALVTEVLRSAGLPAAAVRRVGSPRSDERFVIRLGGRELFASSVAELRALWSDTTFRMQALRDDPGCASEEHAIRTRPESARLSVKLTFDPRVDPSAEAPATLRDEPAVSESRARPRVAILREQGVNGQLEMAAAFHAAGFQPVDVHMTDVLSGRDDLSGYAGLVACGGFSYGDVLGAGQGWARSILFNAAAREAFTRFFATPTTFALGVCNGCQMMSSLGPLIPGAEHFPEFVTNRSGRFEARTSLVEVAPSPSILLRGMVGSRIPIAVAHGEGRVVARGASTLEALGASGCVALRFVDASGVPAERYPTNPNGSPDGVTGVCSRDGRVTIMMPHPERVFRLVQQSWWPRSSADVPEAEPTGLHDDDGPWLRLFRNARRFVRVTSGR